MQTIKMEKKIRISLSSIKKIETMKENCLMIRDREDLILSRALK